MNIILIAQHTWSLMMSSLHGPYGLGYTYATMAITIGSKVSKQIESKKMALV